MIPGWLIFLLWVLSAAVLTVMVAISVVHLMPQGLLILDSRVGGYDADAVSRYIDALGPLGIAKYAGPLQSLDTVFPALLAITLAATFLWVTRGMAAVIRVLCLLPAAAYGLADYAENMFITGLLRSWQGVLDPEMVRWSSALTQAKFAMLGITLGLLLGVVVLRAGKGRG